MKQPNHNQRLVIYASDIEKITGLSMRSVYRLMHHIRVAFGKAPRSFILITEFCYYTNIPEELVRSIIGH